MKPASSLKAAPESLQLYRLLWQFEQWLRYMVYVEVRSVEVDWSGELEKLVRNWPPSALQRDKQQRHMATPHQSALSFLTLGELKQIITAERYWRLFEGYFPPQDVFIARLKEIEQVRNRVAHFRAPNDRDVDRVRLFLGDIDAGIFRFCSSFGDEWTSLSGGVSDLVHDHFVATHESRRIVEMMTGASTHVASQDPREPVLGFSLGLSVRPWAQGQRPWVQAGTVAGVPGIVYRARFRAAISNYRSMIRYDELLAATERVHKDCLLIRVERQEVSVTVPSILGTQRVIDTIEVWLRAALGIVRHGDDSLAGDPEKTVTDWPEYVVGKDNPLDFITESMPCTMFPDD